MKPITNDAEQRVNLATWLENYIGKDEADKDNSCVSIIDLSLVPNEITHLVTAVISRIIFESLQRYRRLEAQKQCFTMWVIAAIAHLTVFKCLELAD